MSVLAIASPPRLPTSKQSEISLAQPVDMDDLLAETLSVDGSPGLGERDYIDDLEDIVSMSVAQQLHSRRSHSQMQTSPPLTASNSSPPPPSSTRFSPSPSSSASETDGLSSGTAVADKAGKRRPSAIPRPGGAARSDGKSSRTPSPELARRKGFLPPEAEAQGVSPKEPAEAEEEKWETLQVGSPALPLSSNGTEREAQSVSPARPKGPAAPNGARPGAAKSPKSSASAAGMSHSKSAAAVGFPPTSASSSTPLNFGGAVSTPARGRPRPSAGSISASKSSPSSASSMPRKRAQTTLTNGASSSPASTSPPSTVANKPRAASRAPRAGPASSGTPVRRKSLSTTQELASLRARACADPLTSAPLPSSTPAPDWSLDPPPLVYRTSRGDLAFGKEAEKEMMRRGVGREEAIVPAVARRLEAERLAKLQAEGGQIGQGEGEGEVLVTEWGPDGKPRRAVDWTGRKLVAGSSGKLEPEDGDGAGSVEEATPLSIEEARPLPPPAAAPPVVDERHPHQPSEPAKPNDPSPSPPLVPFHSSLPPRTSSHSNIRHDSPAPSTPLPSQQRQQQQPISLDPLPSNTAAASEKHGRPMPQTAQAEDEARGKGGGCCRCVIS